MCSHVPIHRSLKNCRTLQKPKDAGGGGPVFFGDGSPGQGGHRESVGGEVLLRADKTSKRKKTCIRT